MTTSMIICSDCHIEKSIELFKKGKKKCLECTRRYAREYQVKKKLAASPKAGKLCLGCNCEEDKINQNFRRGQPICKTCESDPTIVYDKVCGDCGESKPSDVFRKNRKKCHDCEKSSGRNYRRTTTKAAEWVSNNPERMIELQKNWYEDNKPMIREKDRLRKENDPHYKMIQTYRVIVSRLFRGASKVSDQIGSTHESFRAWLVFCFRDDMTCENYGPVWNIDHALPLDLLSENSKNPIAAEKLKSNGVSDHLLGWYNTQPLTCGDNREKGEDISIKHLRVHLRRLHAYVSEHKELNTIDYRKYVHGVGTVMDGYYHAK